MVIGQKFDKSSVLIFFCQTKSTVANFGRDIKNKMKNKHDTGFEPMPDV